VNLRSKFSILLILANLLLLLSCQQQSDKAKVIQVIDGDTIIIQGGYHVRYIGIDAPEKDEFSYLGAKQLNQELVEGKKIRLEKDVSDKDKYGRLLYYIFVDETFVNAELVRLGYAYARAYPPDTKYRVFLEAMEKEARQKQRGIWRSG